MLKWKKWWTNAAKGKTATSWHMERIHEMRSPNIDSRWEFVFQLVVFIIALSETKRSDAPYVVIYPRNLAVILTCLMLLYLVCESGSEDDWSDIELSSCGLLHPIVTRRYVQYQLAEQIPNHLLIVLHGDKLPVANSIRSPDCFLIYSHWVPGDSYGLAD